MGGCGASAKKAAVTEAPNSEITYIEGADFVGVIKAVDTENKTVTAYNASFEETGDYTYSGATEIYSKNERDMSVDEIEIGEAYEFYTSDDGTQIEKLQEASDITVAEDTQVSVDADEQQLTVQGVTYPYTDNLVVYSDGSYIEPLEITDEDRVTFRGVLGQAYSLVVTQGHGYVKPKNYSNFVGGKVIVHGEAILSVTDNMLLTVPEGSQKITMANSEFTGTATVEVKRGQVTTLDMSKFTQQSPDIARVNFKIDPEGAELYLDGALTDYSKSVKLAYGNHSVQVKLEGYNDYSGILNVKEANPTVSINLGQESAEVESEATTDPDDSSEAGTSSDTTAATEDVGYDSDHTITVSAPKGAAVYINGTYKGEIPCSFTKITGEVTLTLTMDGYTTKSYQVEIQDDSQDISWSFPELTKKGEG
jgi:hypothetical protein